MDSDPGDEELMRRLQGGEDAALAQLMQRWEIPVKRIGAKFSTWCFSIAANQAKNRLRWWRRRPAISLNAWTEAGGDTADESRVGESASSKAVAHEQISAVQAAVAALPLDLRTALVLFEYEDLSMAEIAAALDCSAKAVENRLYHARQQLKQALQPIGEVSR